MGESVRLFASQHGSRRNRDGAGRTEARLRTFGPELVLAAPLAGSGTHAINHERGAAEMQPNCAHRDDDTLVRRPQPFTPMCRCLAVCGSMCSG